MKTVNLDEIIRQNAVHEFIDEQDDNMVILFKEHLKDSYIEFGKRLLELAAENAICKDNYNDVDFREDGRHWVDTQSITDTIKQVEV